MTIIDITNLSLLVPLDGAISEKICSREKVSYNHLKSVWLSSIASIFPRTSEPNLIQK